MFKGGVNRLVQKMNTSDEIHSQNLIFDHFARDWPGRASAGTRTLTPHFFCNHPEALSSPRGHPAHSWKPRSRSLCWRLDSSEVATKAPDLGFIARVEW